MTIRELKRFGSGALAGILLSWTGGGAMAQGPVIQNGPTPGAVAPSGVAPVAQRNYLNKRTIQLPIQIADSARASIKEIHLYAKEQASAPWTLRDKAAPLQNAFTFQAPADGEYAFTMVTIDRQGRSYPADIRNEQPGLIVTIDTQAPTVELFNLGNSPEGQLVQCEINDLNLDSTRLRFAYQGGDRVFRPLEPMPGRGNVFCIPAQVVHTGLIQVTAEDLAGNQTTRQEQLRSMKAPMKAARVEPQSKNNLQPVGVKPQPGVEEQEPVKNSIPRPLPTELVKGTAGQTLPMPTELAKPSTPTERPFSSRPIGSEEPRIPEGKPGTPFKASDRIENVTPVGLSNPVGPQIINDGGNQPVTTSTSLRAPVGKYPVMNNTRITLDYQIENAQASVAVVEIWLTRDQGRSWQKHAEVPGNRSPIEVQLPGEGLFGLTLVARNGKTAMSPPAPGDTPDSWIEVDATRPTARLEDVQTNFDRGQANVQIRWSAQDKNFATGPVELLYSATQQGPWILIAKGLPAQGQHRWTPPSGIGSHVHLQLIATDAAGNRAVVGTADPVAIGAPIPPRAVIRTISTGVANPRIAPPQ